MLQSWAATCNGFRKSLQSLQEVELSSAASVAQCNFLCNMCCNCVATKVAGRSQRVTCSLCNLSRNFLDLQQLHKVELGSTLCNDCMEFVLNRLQLAACDCTV